MDYEQWMDELISNLSTIYIHFNTFFFNKFRL